MKCRSHGGGNGLQRGALGDNAHTSGFVAGRTASVINSRRGETLCKRHAVIIVDTHYGLIATDALRL